LLILIGGGGAIVLTMNANAQRTVSMLLAKLNPAALLKRKKAGTDDLKMATMEQSSGADGTAAVKKSPKNKASDDILDLSLPDD
jgi:hypothetical protein